MNETRDEIPIGDESVAAAERSGPDRRAMARGLITLLLIALATTFAVQNSESVDVTFLTWEFSVSKILLMIVSAVVGIVVAKLVGRLVRNTD